MDVIPEIECPKCGVPTDGEPLCDDCQEELGGEG